MGQGQVSGRNCRWQRNPKPRIDGPWCGDPTSVTGTLWQQSTSKLSTKPNSSQIAVPWGGPAMRGGLQP